VRDAFLDDPSDQAISGGARRRPLHRLGLKV